MIQSKIDNLVSVAISLLCNKMLSGHKEVKMVPEMKFEDFKIRRNPNDATVGRQKMIVGRH